MLFQEVATVHKPKEKENRAQGLEEVHKIPGQVSDGEGQPFSTSNHF